MCIRDSLIACNFAIFLKFNFNVLNWRWQKSEIFIKGGERSQKKKAHGKGVWVEAGLDSIMGLESFESSPHWGLGWSHIHEQFLCILGLIEAFSYDVLES